LSCGIAYNDNYADDKPYPSTIFAEHFDLNSMTKAHLNIENKNVSSGHVFEATHAAKMVRGIRASKLAMLAKNL